MLNRDVFLHDPTESAIPNDGVAKVGVPETPEQWDILAHELRMFVCEGEYERGLERILSSYLTHIGKNVQPAVWVSGFYGSGKSHLVRVLEALWSDIEFPNGERARNMVALPDSIREQLIELTTDGKRRGGLWSAAGTLSAAGDVSVRLAVLSVIFKAAHLPSIYHQARFVLYLKQRGLYETIVAELEHAGKSLDYELENMLVSPPLSAALLHASPGLANSPAEVSMLLEGQFPQAKDIADDEFISTLRSVLRLMSDRGDALPCTLIVLDELQQFVGENPTVILDLQNVVERCVESFGSTLLFVGTGQAELHATPQLQKLLGRFTVKVKLEDRDIEHVIREVILRKDETKREALNIVLDQARAEIDRQLQGTKIGPRSDDRQILSADYPLLPTRRRLWEGVLRSVDSAGLAGQLRTQLRIVHDETRDVAMRPLGVVIPADRIYKHLQADMLNSSLLLREVSNRIEELDDGTDDGRLHSRLCAMIFLIDQLPKEGVAETGVRATVETLADLLVEDIKTGSAMLRQQIPVALNELVDDGILHAVGEEYHVQTVESREWQRDYNRRFASARNNDVQIANGRTTAFRNAISAALKNVRPRQGVRNEARTIDPQYDDVRPNSTVGVPIWVPLSWTGTDSQFINEAVEAGTSSPIVFVYLPRQNVDAIRNALASIAAAEETLSARGVPATDEGRQARSGMMSRLEHARGELTALVTGILDNARVFQGGGNEVADGSTLTENVAAAAQRSLARLYPDFGMADHQGWPTVLSRAKQGSPSALEAVGHRGPSQEQPVAREILHAVGSGMRGADVRKRFEARPYGWPQDAIDGALVALVADGKLRAASDSRIITTNDLNQTSISKADFRAEEITVSAIQRLDLAGLSGLILGRQVNVNELNEVVPGALDAVRNLANEAGGSSPSPERPNTAHIDELRGLSGNERLFKLWELRERLRNDCFDWRERKQRIDERWTRWEHLNRLLDYSGGLETDMAIRQQTEAIRQNRSLISEPDPVRPIVDQLSVRLRERLLALHDALENERSTRVAELVKMPEWHQISDDAKDEVLRNVELLPLARPDVSTDEKLLAALHATPLTTLEATLDAIPQRMERARAEILRLRAPGKVVPIKLPTRTIKTRQDIEDYIASIRQLLLKELGDDGKTILSV